MVKLFPYQVCASGEVDALSNVALAITTGAVQVVDLTHTLDPDFPVIILPPEFGQCALPYGRSLRLR